MKAFIYILQSRSSGKYYIGSTTNLKRRMHQHSRGHTRTTKSWMDAELVFCQEVKSILIAREVEKRIKSWKRKDFVDRIVKEGHISFLN